MAAEGIRLCLNDKGMFAPSTNDAIRCMEDPLGLAISPNTGALCERAEDRLDAVPEDEVAETIHSISRSEVPYIVDMTGILIAYSMLMSGLSVGSLLRCSRH